ncbi:MAG: hypothetical protein WHS87_00420 [Anaerolineales bacterium]
MIHPAFQYDRYLLKRQVLALTGKFRIYNPQGDLVLFCEQKMFRLREDFRLYADESKTQEVLIVKARQILDFAATYDVIDSLSGERIGTWRRRGFASLLRDRWELLDAQERPVGFMTEDSLGLALLRRFLLGALLPQNYDLFVGEQRLADLRQRFHLFRYELEIDFSMDASRRLDRRLGLAAAILLAAIEGKQEKE